MNTDLLSTTSRVETPFIIVTIAGVTFGAYSSESKNIINSSGAYKVVLTQFPNFMQSLSVTKINGALNTYTLNMRYTIREGEDPNLLDKVFSKAKKDRTIKLSYGDLSTPAYIYKEEEALITDLKSSIDLAGSSINYTISCVSKALSLSAGTYNFPKRKARPSDIIEELLYNTKNIEKYGLLDIFYGMIDKDKVKSKGLILTDDRTVTLEAKQNISVLNYLKYLVSCMSNVADNNNELIRKNEYTITIYDDITNDWGGPYFKINKVSTNISKDSLSTYQIDIGFPSQNNVIAFNLDDNETYSILFDYNDKIEQSNYVYRIDDNGKIVQEYTSALASDNNLMKTTEAEKAWWTNVTQYPISATLIIKGLLRPAILMTYVKINVWFFGRKHISSGYYIVTKQTDEINSSGYRTTLKLTRIGAENYNDN